MSGCDGRGHGGRNRHSRWGKTARRVECLDLVPVAPFREKFLQLQKAGDMTLGDLCDAMGWGYFISEEKAKRERRSSCWKPDTSHAQRNLGIRRRNDSYNPKEHVPYAMAVKLCDALGMDPHEAGI